MAIGIQGFAQDLLSPRVTSGDGPGAYDRLLVALRDLRDDAVLLAPLEAAWRDRAFEGVHARPLLILAALRYLALGDADHPLATEVLLDGEAPDLLPRVREALADPALVPVLRTRHIQTNEPGRALAWGLVVLALGLPHRRFALAELGASAGLNLVVDLTSIPYKLGAEKVTGLDFPSPHLRLGLDAAPIDATRDEDALRWLRACIWPGQPERIDRFEAALAVWRRPWRGASPAPTLEPHRLGVDDTAGRLDLLASDPGVEATVAFETTVAPYLPPDALGRYHADLERWLRSGRQRVWVTLDPAPPGPSGSAGGPMSLQVRVARAGEVVALELARTAYHPSGCLIVPGAIAALREAWSRP